MSRPVRTPAKRHDDSSPMGLFEENFRLLESLLPDLLNGDRYAIHGRCGRPELRIRVLQRTPYTTTIRLRKGFGGDGRLLPDLGMDVRMYHDASVAEVLSYQGCERLPAPYEVPAGGRYLSDEKRQVNLLLHQLLVYYIRNGYRLAVG